MKNLGVKEAAEAIRSTVDAAVLPPEEAHQMRFLQGVCGELGIDHTNPENLHRVAHALQQHDIAIHEGHEFPKWVGEGSAAVVVNDAAEEEAYHAKMNPPPAEEKPAELAEAEAKLTDHHTA